MGETQKRLSHTFLRMGFLLTFLSLFCFPLASVFAQSSLNTGNNPGNPNVPGYFGGGSTGGSTGGGLDYGRPRADSGIIGGANGGLGFPTSVTGGATVDPVTGVITPGTGGGAGSGPVVTETPGEVTLRSAQNAANANMDERAYGIMISLGGWIAGLGGNLFEISFDHFVIGMGCYFSNAGGSNCGRVNASGQIGGVVDELWVIIRDLFNLALIFSLIFIGFKMIWNADDSGTRRALGYLILAALLVNFSLYLAKVVVDVANFSATAIFTQMTTVSGPSGGTGFSIDDGAGAFSLGAGNRLAGMFMTVLAIPSWFTPGEGVANSWTFAIMALIFLIFLGAIFVYAAFMMMARFIAIVILLIFSPLMFIGWVLPSFSGYSSKWRKMFVSYAFYAPVFVFLLYLSLYSLLSLSSILGVTSGGYATAFAPDGTMAAGSMNIFVFFFVGAGFLFASTKVAGMMADAGAGAGMNMASSFAKRISTGAAAVGGGYLANSATGRLGKYLERDADANEARTGRSNTFSRYQRKLGGKLTQTKVGGAPSYKEYHDEVDTADKKAGSLKSQRNASLILAGTGTSAADIAAKERAIAGLSSADVIAMAKTKDGEKTLKANAHLLRPEQIKALREDKEVDESTKKTILGARADKVKAAVTAGTAVKDLNDDQLASVDVAFLKEEENAVGLNETKIDKLPQLTASEKQVVKEARKEALKKVAAGNTIGGMTQDKLVNSKPEDLAKLPSDVFKIEDFSNRLSANTIKSRHFADLDADTQKNIRQYLENAIATAQQAGVTTPPNHKARLDEIEAWFKSPQGSSFGK